MYDLFSDFFDSFDVFPVYREERTCPQCGRRYSDFQKSGKFGCEKCYTTFRQPVTTTLRQIHGTTTHTGKIPAHCAEELKRKRHYAKLKKELSIAVAEENYEKAAKLHKEIKAMGDVEKEGGK